MIGLDWIPNHSSNDPMHVPETWDCSPADSILFSIAGLALPEATEKRNYGAVNNTYGLGVVHQSPLLNTRMDPCSELIVADMKQHKTKQISSAAEVTDVAMSTSGNRKERKKREREREMNELVNGESIRKSAQTFRGARTQE